MNTRRLPLALAIVIGLSPPSLLAMGLGQLEVKSGLNQPLVAEIPIISATPSELDKFDVRLASPDAFARVGLDRPGELTANLEFTVAKNARGQPVIRVSTPARFNEPVLSFLIEAEWGKGKVTREYTALIDPPYIAAAVIQPMLAPAITQAPAPEYVPPAPEVAAPEPVLPSPAAPERAIASVPPPMPPEPTMPAPRPIPAEPAPRIAERPAPPPPQPVPVPAPDRAASATAEPAPAPGQYGPVSPGQTLWSIANSVRPDRNVSVNQMMVALLRANPDAFAQDNINRLKRGSVLRVPGQQELARLSSADATALVNLQASAWRTPRKAVPQPAEAGPATDSSISAAPATPAPDAAPRVAKVKRARTGSRLEIVPPSGNALALGSQSGAAQGAGGTELRAELVQSREDLAARTSEVNELKSRVADLEKQQSDRQRLIEMQNSQMKALQDRLAQSEAAKASVPAAAAVAPETPAATPAGAEPAAAPVVSAAPWYFNPILLFGLAILVIGGLVYALRRSKARSAVVDGPVVGRLSDDEALRKSMAKTRQASERIAPVAAPVAAAVVAPVDKPLEDARQAVASRPNDLEAHLTLLRLYHSRGNALEYESAAQVMRQHLTSTMDPRWREAVIMGATLMPGHALFSQAGWNTPRYSEPEPARAAPPAPLAPAIATATAEPPPTPVRVFDTPDEVTDNPHFDAGAEAFGSGLGAGHDDVHRNEAELMAEDDASGTRIELAKAYLDIGDLDGARSMLEEVVAEGGSAAQAEARRILKEIG